MLWTAAILLILALRRGTGFHPVFAVMLAASAGRTRILDLVPSHLHQRVPLILGCKAEVERIERYHWEHEQGLDRIYSSPLFKERSLFLQS